MMTIEQAAALAEELVMNYCNISEIPTGLAATCENIAADIMTIKARSADAAAGVPTVVTSIEEGDTKTTFGLLAAGKNVDEILTAYSAVLKRYRRVTF